ncbi:hypothetical protein CW714_09855 [Methanophagales archaeon]|nr:MAG: hypothetical protein CW714_09855 [Methanophagales archaeon]
MNSKKIALMAIAIVAIGIFALPSTVSLFSGQHTWYDLGEGKNDVPCEKCHAEIKDEMMSSDNGVHRDLTCAMCHRAPFTGYGYARGHAGPPYPGPPLPGEEAHAASTVECMDCHDGKGDKGTIHYADPEYGGVCGKCHKGWGYNSTKLSASGFGLTPWAADTGEKAAHTKFVLDAMNETLMDGANEACIACHTRVGVNITWTKNENLEFTANENETGYWTIPSFAASGENVTQVNTPNNWTQP